MARGRQSSLVVLLTATKRNEWEALQRRPTISVGRARRARMGWLRADGLSLAEVARRVEVAPRVVATWITRDRRQGLPGLGDNARPGRPPGFPPPAGAVPLVKRACARPELCGRSLSPWDGTELARALVQAGVTESISPSTVRRILAHHKRKPWRPHRWLSPQYPRDAAF